MAIKNIDLKATAIIGFLLVAPFAVTEWITTTGLPRSNFPIPLFIVMWIAATVFILLLVSIHKTLRAKKKDRNYVMLVVKIAVSAFIAWSWIMLVIDQMPCFLGATGC